MKHGHFVNANRYVVQTSEGGYVLTDDPADIGGQTFAGISRVHNPQWAGWKFIDDEPTDLESPYLIAQVAKLYRLKYWHPSLDAIASARVAVLVHSCMVLYGSRTGFKLVQEAAHTEIDGVPGPATVRALNRGDWQAFAQRLFVLRAGHHLHRVQDRKGQRRFLFGWLRRAMVESALPD